MPAVNSLRLPVVGPVVVEKAVAGVLIHVEFVLFTVFLERFFVERHLLRCRAVIFRAEEAQDRALQVGRVVNRRNRPLGGELVCRHHDPAAPAIDDRIEPGRAARNQHCLPSP